MATKELLWVGSAREDLRAMSRTVRHEIGVDLRLVQSGDVPRRWKPMSSVGAGVAEITVKLDGEFRALYVAKFREGIYVLHVFQKKSRKTAQMDIDLARARYTAVLRTRAQE